MAQYNEADHPRDPHSKVWVNKNKDTGDDDLESYNDPDLPVSAHFGPDERLAEAVTGMKPMGMNAYEKDMHMLADGQAKVTADGITGPNGRPVDAQALKDSPHARKLISNVLNDPAATEGLKVAQRRRAVRQAWAAATPYQRRHAIEKGVSLRFIPAGDLARSLRHRRPDQAMGILKTIHAQDRNASAAIIRSGFPNTREDAYRFINGTKDTDQGKGTAARRYLRLKFSRSPEEVEAWNKAHPESPRVASAGRPSDFALKAMGRRLDSMRDDPAGQAAAFYQIAFGDGRSKDRGNGIAAEMLAYERRLTPAAAQAFMSMTPGDMRRANSTYHPDQRRLTAMRANMHALYPEIHTDRPAKGVDASDSDRFERAAYRA